MNYDLLIPLIAALPLAGFAFSVLFGRRLQATFGKRAASLVPVTVVVLAWLAAHRAALAPDGVLTRTPDPWRCSPVAGVSS